jgi:hypothetical protein
MPGASDLFKYCQGTLLKPPRESEIIFVKELGGAIKKG